jgi:outer membrane immunogenic protein
VEGGHDGDWPRVLHEGVLVRILKTAFVGTAILFSAGLVTVAQAADVYAPSNPLPYEPPYIPSVTWNGFYIGVNAGAAINTDDDVTYNYVDKNKKTVTGKIEGGNTAWLGGLHAGYNWQVKSVVFGLEGDVDAGEDVQYLATIRARLGFTYKHTLMYATGGAAFASFNNDVFSSDTQTGWVAGIGVEEKLKHNISIGIEGLRYSFSDVGTNYTDVSVDQDAWVVRARLTYHFD